MVNAYKEGRQKEADADNARLDTKRTYLSEAYEKAHSLTAKLTKEVEKNRARRLEVCGRLKKRQEDDEKLLEDAFAICAEA